MAKINISFNNTNYTIDEASLSSASAALKAHLSNVMNGSGATITLDGVAYNIDSTKLSAATTDFVNHLGKITGNGHKVVINGVEHSVDANKVAGAVGELETLFGGLHSEDGGEILGFPIAWNTMEVMGGTTVDFYGMPYVKVSDFAPTATELANTECIAGEYAQQCVSVQDINGVLLAQYGDINFISVTVAGECADLGATFPETGFYVLDFGTLDGVDIDCVVYLVNS